MLPSSYPLQNGHTQHTVPGGDALDQGGQDENSAIDTDHAHSGSTSTNAGNGAIAGMGNDINEPGETANSFAPNSDSNSVMAGGAIIGGMQYEEGTGSSSAENGMQTESMANGYPND
jgi:hypothetical protein